MLRRSSFCKDDQSGFRVERLALSGCAADFQDGRLLQRRRGDGAVARSNSAPSLRGGAARFNLLPVAALNPNGYTVDRPRLLSLHPERAVRAGYVGDLSRLSRRWEILCGRPRIDDHDRLGHFVIDLSQARPGQFFPNENPLGKRLKVSWERDPEAEVIDVSADIRHKRPQHATRRDHVLTERATAELHSFTGRPDERRDTGHGVAGVKERSCDRCPPTPRLSEIKTDGSRGVGLIASPRVQATLLGKCWADRAPLGILLGIYAVVS